ncbi:MAG: 4-hydroxythreonine-4-phosphate dehydrogenase PdxA [bacterium]|nr:4-hydroxythreonine-4-phosphate dehydrogenase PdxA [bacterium]
MSNRKLVITLGDPNSIGPEIVIEALNKKPLDKIILVGSRDCLLKLKAEKFLGNLIEVGPKNFKVQWGKEGHESGRIAYESLEESVRLLESGKAHVILNAPVSKKAIEASVPGFVGHTGFYESALGDGKDAVMSFCGNRFHLALFTHHVPLARVSDIIMKADLVDWLQRCIELFEQQVNQSLSTVVLGFNPHAGEQGVLSLGEDEKISEAVSKLRIKRYDISGPKPADTFFQEKNLIGDKHHLVIAMQHDQGLIPFKMTHFGQGVATTLGLRYPRFTVDHGTAFDIAGKGQADPSSMIHSLELALKTLDV